MSQSEKHQQILKKEILRNTKEIVLIRRRYVQHRGLHAFNGFLCAERAPELGTSGMIDMMDTTDMMDTMDN